MNINVVKGNSDSFNSDAIAYFQPEDAKWLNDSLKWYGDGSPLQAQARTMIATGDMTGKKDEIVVMYPNYPGVKTKRMLLVGMGKPETATLETMRRIAAKAAKKTVALKG